MKNSYAFSTLKGQILVNMQASKNTFCIHHLNSEFNLAQLRNYGGGSAESTAGHAKRHVNELTKSPSEPLWAAIATVENSSDDKWLGILT